MDVTRDLSLVITALWIGWLLYWLAASFNVKTTRWRDSIGSQLLYRVPSLIAVMLLVGSPDWMPAALDRRFIAAHDSVLEAATAMVAAGLAFAVWARLHLGRNWSVMVTVKEAHALVMTGPYRVVRHPIYTGVLLALAGTALAVGRWRAVIAVLVALAGFAYKMRVEERRMREMFPAYEDYRLKVAAIIPFLI